MSVRASVCLSVSGSRKLTFGMRRSICPIADAILRALAPVPTVALRGNFASGWTLRAREGRNNAAGMRGRVNRIAPCTLWIWWIWDVMAGYITTKTTDYVHSLCSSLCCLYDCRNLSFYFTLHYKKLWRVRHVVQYVYRIDRAIQCI